MASDDTVVAASLGMAVSHAPACGPPANGVARGGWLAGLAAKRGRESRGCVCATRGTASHAASHRGLHPGGACNAVASGVTPSGHL